MAIWELGVGLFLYSKQNLLLPVLLSLSLSLSEITVPVLDKAISMCLWLRGTMMCSKFIVRCSCDLA